MTSHLTPEIVRDIVDKNRRQLESKVSDNVQRIDEEIAVAINAAYEYPIIMNVDLPTENDKVAWKMLQLKYERIFKEKCMCGTSRRTTTDAWFGWFHLKK